ncbi:alpha-L-arabinofuranosidase C-terminal domain-containing protein [Occultella aeris]|uniref:non-reducing end alpha-L-arabinofuranosidase n=1 Tax=Occultella aeris TaxID=2761496 RepID=A0A7M4DQR0_9MICO|nr:alpha-L-arabinofuranosidase C-terminal domain-containing protein [Occultella aeris]VZO39804.1 Intracellular exo-alpha-L-arabinofuranosidase 2 [Occultella aeris]
MTNARTLTSTITVAEPAAPIEINRDIYGQYFEHVEDCVYPGLMDDDGLREDVIAAAAELQVPVVRWPGGCFADCYHWEEGIGPLERRPVRPNWHWGGGQLESHQFGTHEFLNWCERVGAGAYINVNMGTGTMIEALRWLDYTTGSQPTSDVLERMRNGRHDPWPVAYWGLGNETWGAWEAGRMTASEYADTLDNWARFFRRYQPDVRLVGVGSSGATDPDWDSTVLDVAGSSIDLLSLHLYGSRVDRDGHPAASSEARRAVMLAPLHFEAQIEAMGQLVRKHNLTASRVVGIAIDEWNIRHYRQEADDTFRLDRTAPRTGSDAIFVAGVFHAMLRAADVVTMANYVFLVNGNAVLDARHGTVTRSALFPIFRTYRERLTGTRMDVQVDAPEVEVPDLHSRNPSVRVDPSSVPRRVPALDAVAARNTDGVLQIAILNRSEQTLSATLDVPAGTITLAESYRSPLGTDALEHDTRVATSVGDLHLPAASCTFITVAH